MTAAASLSVLFVRSSEPTLDVDDFAAELADHAVEAVRAETAVDRLADGGVGCLLVDPSVTAATLGQLLSAVRGLKPSVPVVHCVTDDPISVPDIAENSGGVEHVTVEEPGEIASIADRVRSVLPDERSLPHSTAGDYQRLFAKAPAPIVIYNDEAVLEYANEATAELLNVEDSASLRGRPVREFVADSVVETVRGRISRVIDDRQPVESVELELRTTDGQHRYVEATTVPVTYRGNPGGQTVLNDVTERRRREQRLQEERDRLDALFESVPQPIVNIRFEDEEPVVQHVNAAFESTFGYDQATLLGESLNDFIVPPDRKREAEQLDRESTVEEELDREITRETVDGPREFRLRSVSFDTEDATREAVATYIDVTRQKQRERELRRKNDRLEAFANIVSHDLRNPLNVISGRLALARETGETEHFEAIGRSAERMETLIDNLLTLARQGETLDETAPVDLGAAVERAWMTVVTDDATLVTENAVGTVDADETRLAELFENLFRNCIDHVSDDVTVRVGREDGHIFVEDNGPGIPPGEREDVFDVGYTTAEDGTGYGLAIVKEIAEAHGWTITVTDGREGGARFEIETE